MATGKKSKTTSSSKGSARSQQEDTSGETVDTRPASTPPEVANKHVVLPEEVVRRLSEVVYFPTEAELHQFVSDAINTYVQLGQLSTQGKQFFVGDGPEETQARLRFPFENPTS